MSVRGRSSKDSPRLHRFTFKIHQAGARKGIAPARGQGRRRQIDLPPSPRSFGIRLTCESVAHLPTPNFLCCVAATTVPANQMGHVELDARHSSKLYEVIISRRLIGELGRRAR